MGINVNIKVGDRFSFCEMPDEYDYRSVFGIVREINTLNNWVKVDLVSNDGKGIRAVTFDLDGSRWDHSGEWKHDANFICIDETEEHQAVVKELLDGVHPTLAEPLRQLAYDRGHSAGYREVETILQEYVFVFRNVNELLNSLPPNRSILDVKVDK